MHRIAVVLIVCVAILAVGCASRIAARPTATVPIAVEVPEATVGALPSATMPPLSTSIPPSATPPPRTPTREPLSTETPAPSTAVVEASVTALVSVTATRIPAIATRPPAQTSTPLQSTFSLSIRLDSPTILQVWNQYALPTDGASTHVGGVRTLTQSKSGVKALVYENVADTPHIVNVAKANGISAIIFDFEKTSDCGVLAATEATAYHLAQGQGVQFVFSPTGSLLMKCYQTYPSMIQNADVIFYQTEYIQDNPKYPNYLDTVKANIHSIKSIKPGIPVWVQLSVNPPAKRDVTADEVVSLIKGLEDGSSENPSQIYIFYDSESVLAGRVEVMEQVLKVFRSPTGS